MSVVAQIRSSADLLTLISVRKWLVVSMIAAAACGSPQRTTIAPSPSPSESPAASTSPSALPSASAKGLPLGDLEIGRDGRILLKLEVEIAETPASRYQGLRNVERLESNAGMAFLFQAPSRGSFTMQDTLIPLDIAFWDQNNVIVDILHMTPCRSKPCPPYTPRTDYVAAIEMNSGLLEDSGVKVGDLVTLAKRAS